MREPVMEPPPPRRIRITHPRTDAARRAPLRPVSHEIGEQTPVGEVYMSSLIRSQRRLGVIVCGLVAVCLGGIALFGVFAPDLARIRVFGMPLPWLVLGIVIYPVLILLAVYTVHQAERNERDFSELADPDAPTERRLRSESKAQSATKQRIGPTTDPSAASGPEANR